MNTQESPPARRFSTVFAASLALAGAGGGSHYGADVRTPRYASVDRIDRTLAGEEASR